MASNTNTTTLEGNLVADPELRFTPSGTAVVNMSIAQTARRLDENNEWVDGHTSYFDIVAWRNLAEHSVDEFGKGDRIVVTGKLKQRRWKTEDGHTRSKVEVVAEDLSKSIRFGTKPKAQPVPAEPEAPETDMYEEPF